MATAQNILVGMSEIQVAKGEGQLVCLGLGSCIGLAALDPVTHIAGMVHVMLPEAFADKPNEKPGKFADTGIPALIAQLEKMGAQKSRLVLAMAGGAQVFKFGAGVSSKLDIGARNSIAVAEMLKKLGLRCIAQDVGGSLGRTVTMTVETGIMMVKTVSQGERRLCCLRG